MRIAIFSDSFYPEIGGIQDSILSLGKELGQRGHAIDYYAPRASKKDFARVNLPAEELYLGKTVRVHRFWSLPYPGPTQQARAVIPTFLRWLAIKKPLPDVIHTNTFFGVGIEALAAKTMLRLPIVGTNHWAISEFARYSGLGKKFFGDASRAYVSWYYNHCNYVTAPSESVIAEMRAFGLTAPAKAISNPIDTTMFSPSEPREKKAHKKKFGLSDSTVIFAGRLGSEKNIDVIIRALPLVRARIPDITFAVAGHGSEREALARLARNIGVENAVKFLGTLDKPTLAAAYNASEIFAIMSTSETQSMVLLQAMACGIPAIGARYRALPEYIPQETGFLAEPGDAAELAEKIIFLLTHAATRKKMGSAAHGFVQQFSASSIADRWESIYGTAIDHYIHRK